MSLLRFDQVSLDFGDHKLLREADFSVEEGERVCLIGRNGAGKTSMLRLIEGTLEPDHGKVQRSKGLTVSQLTQSLPQALSQSVTQVVASGLAWLGELVARYEATVATATTSATNAELNALHQQIDSADGWRIDQRVAAMISELDLPGEALLGELSGGWQRRVMLAKALVSQPDLLLLDEPTNHLDLVSIEWLENTISAYSGCVLFITHDRAFLQRLATRIVEIDRGKLISWPGSYSNYLRRKEKALEDEDEDNARFDKRLAQEEAWIRQGIKARRTRNEGRVRALQAMREERAKRVQRDSPANIQIGAATASGRRVIEAHNISFSYGEAPLFAGLSVKIRRGDRVALIGNNGVGKSTLLMILLGKLAPQSGTVKHGNNLEIGFFDQLRHQLDLDKTIVDNIGEGREYIDVNGRQRHIIGYLKGFLFSPKRAMTPIKALSGGERNRVVLARLFSRPSNLLVLDEPTNDLDIETLDVLEAQLVDYPGTLIVVSHDRQFLDNVVTSTLVFESGGVISEYMGGYSDWVAFGKHLATTDPSDAQSPETPRASKPDRTRGNSRKKLTYMLQRELDALPAQLESLEAEIAALSDTVAQPRFYDQPYHQVESVLKAISQKTQELEEKTERWVELEDMSS